MSQLSHDPPPASKPDVSSQAPPVHLIRWRSRIYAIVGLSVLLIVVVALAATVGSVKIPFPVTWQVMISKLPFFHIAPAWSSSIETIILEIRLPRVILAGLVGAALATAGATYQGLFRNPLADPYLIGVAQGASLGAVVGFLLPTAWHSLGLGVVPLLAFIGAIASTAIVYSLARVGKTLPVTTIILAGVALGSLLGSIVSYLIISSGEKMHGIIFWLMGSFSLSQWSDVKLVLPYVVAGIGVILLYARPLNIMQLDEEQALQLGINVERLKLVLLAAATLITAAAVSFVGTIGFVGIIIPHAVRLLWGADYRFLLPLSVLTGAIFMILADVVARTVQAPAEIPIGVITALCGAPFFLYLLRRRKRVIF
ncbi:MAG: iron chelate uptake ABC transporter family permease subunit [Dehalococcoidales bacterium]|nr:iron chelate uptake ABC transporter family permease subunit [Dehalococcoidales bacterium]